MIAGYVVRNAEHRAGVYKVNENRGDDSDREEGRDNEVLSPEL